jgi:hypothetical protein
MDSDDPAWEKNYPAYVVNKCMSHHMDTVLFANEMNRYSFLPSRLQYDFYIHIVRPRKRFSPWGKKEKVNDLEIVKEYYGYSNEKAKQALRILSPTHLDYIKDKLNKGGKKR